MTCKSHLRFRMAGYSFRAFSLFIFVLSVVQPAILAQENYLEGVQQKIKEGNVFVASFDHQFTDGYTKEQSGSSGRVWLSWGQYRIETEGQIIVVDGKTSKVLDTNRNRVIISEYDSEFDDFAPSKILGGLGEEYRVESIKRRAQREEFILMSNDSFSAFETIEITIDKELFPREVKALDMGANLIEMKFSSANYQILDDHFFQLQIPKGAEVIDMRYE
ncbi:MAG: outer membrane lipoprotein carrier protein LolA [Bacteroidetes bacterium]|nr:outer membrane lipoprotein carrier protein LolA [Bacteroidota bacterium]